MPLNQNNQQASGLAFLNTKSLLLITPKEGDKIMVYTCKLAGQKEKIVVMTQGNTAVIFGPGENKLNQVLDLTNRRTPEKNFENVTYVTTSITYEKIVSEFKNFITENPNLLKQSNESLIDGFVDDMQQQYKYINKTEYNINTSPAMERHKGGLYGSTFPVTSQEPSRLSKIKPKIKPASDQSQFQSNTNTR